jgi:hypothetical protein
MRIEPHRFLDQRLRSYPVVTNVRIFQGSAVGKIAASGLARPLVAQDILLGIAFEEADNTGGADAAITVKVETVGDFQVPLTGVTRANIGAACYMSSDNDFTLTSTNNSYVGIVIDAPAANTAIVRLDPYRTGM